jgi:hypothetical protein
MILRFRARLVRTALVVLGAVALTAGAPEGEQAKDADAKKPTPALIELFTSQGCGSCPKANAFLGQLALEPGTIALTYAVSYWDYLGWRDTYAKPEFTDRQKAYSARFKRGVYTPQMIIDGVSHASGLKAKETRAIVEKSEMAGGVRLHGQRAPEAADKARFALSGAAPPTPVDIWIAQYTPGMSYVDVKNGENAGAKVSHYNVVTKLTKIGQFTGSEKDKPKRVVAECTPACVMIVQSADGGPVLAAKMVQGAGAALGPVAAAGGGN